MEKNCFSELQHALEAKFEIAGWSGETRVQQQVQSLHVFGQLAELFIPIAAGAAVAMATGTSGQKSDMPEFAWRYKPSKEVVSQADSPRDRFRPFIPF